MARLHGSKISDFAFTPRVRLMAGCAAIIVAIAPAPATAQATATPAPAATPTADTQTTGLQDIIVTAQKRSQNVQDTPLSVTAVSGTNLATRSVVKVEDLARIDPALQIGHSTGTVTTFIRGIGNPVTTAGNEASVPIFIDDVYFVRAAYPFFSLGSIDRVEVLKGPQGTLFGRNASGGVISVYTRDPNFNTPEVSGKIGAANYKTIYGQAYVNLPITNRLAANFSFDGNRQRGGWGKDINTGLPTFREHHISTRGKILWEPTESTKIKLIGYYVRAYNEQGVYSRPFPGTVGGYPDGLHAGFPALPDQVAKGQIGVLPTLGFYDTNLNFNQYDRSSGYGGSVRIDQSVGFADLVSITALRRNKELYYSEGDNSPVDQLRYQLNILDRQFSQEFQIKSKARSKLTWILGAYYLNALQGFNPTDINGLAPPLFGISNIRIIGKERIKSYAGFGQATYPITDNTNITGGLRYTIDKIGGVGTTVISFLPGIFGPGPFDLTTQSTQLNKTFKKLTYKASIDHHFGRDVMAYANYSRGFKAGTFNTLPLDSPPLRPEVVDAYEIGMKTELFDRTIRLNGALFWNDISNPQVQTARNGVVLLLNAGAARTRGAEFDASAVLAHGLTFNVAGTYLDARFRDFKTAPAYCPSPAVSIAQCRTILTASGASPALIASVGNGNINPITINADGNRLPYASKFKLSASLDYSHNVPGTGKFILNGSANYASKFNWDSDNVIKEPAHTFFDASVQFTPEALHNIGFRLWMKNITDVRYNVGYFGQASGSAFSSSPGAPRTFGGEILFKF